MQTSPFLPAEINNWCCGANAKLDAPWSWQAKAVRDEPVIILLVKFLQSHLHATIAFFWGSSVSHIATFLLSELWPANGTEQKAINHIGCQKHGESKFTNLLRLSCMTRGTWNRWWVCCDIRGSVWKRIIVEPSGHDFKVDLQRRIDYIGKRVQLAINSISHLRRQFRTCFRAARTDIVWLTKQNWKSKNRNILSSLKATSLTFRECSRRTRRANRLLVAPFPHLHRSVLSTRQIQRHQRMWTHAFYVINFMFQDLFHVCEVKFH